MMFIRTSIPRKRYVPISGTAPLSGRQPRIPATADRGGIATACQRPIAAVDAAALALNLVVGVDLPDRQMRRRRRRRLAQRRIA
jgi:hypothetical protein